MGLATGIKVEWASFRTCIGFTLATLALYAAIRFRGTTPELETAPGVIAAIGLSGLAALIATHAGLRANNPLIDDALARSDALMGISAPGLIQSVSGHPWITGTLAYVYHTALLAMFVPVIALSFGKWRQRCWDLAFSFAFGSTVCGMIAVVFPAEGVYAHYAIPAQVVAGMPKGAGTFYFHMFNGLRSGEISTLNFSHLTGVVTFPSFHGAIALMTAFALRDIRWLRPFAFMWCLLVNISAIPMGGHYGTDLVVGALLWAVSAWIMASFQTSPHREPVIASHSGPLAA
jgi:hypothetical protein